MCGGFSPSKGAVLICPVLRGEMDSSSNYVDPKSKPTGQVRKMSLDFL